jgi:hypothetical protein
VKALPILTAAALLLGACASPKRPQAAPGAQALGVPGHAVDPSIAGEALGQSNAGPDTGAIQLPDRITIPAAYRLMLIDGHLALVKETDAQSLDSGPTSLRIITGEISRGELAYQPGLLPQELAAEVASNRESAARMDNALESVMQRSRELSDQAAELKAQAEKLGALLAAAQSHAGAAEAPARSEAPASATPDAPERQTPSTHSPEPTGNPQN